MASIAPQTFPPPSTRTDPNPHKLLFSSSKFSSSGLKRGTPTFQSQSIFSHSPARSALSDSAFCRCNNCGGGVLDDDSSGDDQPSLTPMGRWESTVRDAFRSAFKTVDDVKNSFLNWNRDKSVGLFPAEGRIELQEGPGFGADVDEWDWERWKNHFTEVDEQERIVSVLKSQLAAAIRSENYQDAARIKVAIAAASTKDTVGKVMSHLNRAVQEENYKDAALLRDHAGAGLVGWWAGLSENSHDPYGCIIHISAEHGRYVARSYSPRQLVSAMDGSPMFEIFYTKNKKGEFKQRAVYLKRQKAPLDFPVPSPKAPSNNNLDPLNSAGDKGGLLDENIEDPVDIDERDEDFNFENTLKDLIPGVKVKVMKVTAPNKLDRDFISKVVEQIIEEEDEEQDSELENSDAEDEIKSENDEEQENIILDAGNEIPFGEEPSQIAVKVVVGGLVSKSSSGSTKKDLLRVPAKIKKKDRLSFTFTIEEHEENKSGEKGKAPPNKKAKLQGQRSVDHVMLDLAKVIGKGRIPKKVLKDVGELINLTLNQAQNRQPLSGSTKFSRIDVSGNQDPLNGLYIGAHGLYASEVIHLRRKFGQWKEDDRKKEPSNVEFYEYVEAVKVTGDPYVPAGQVTFY
ncbi:OLC1v1002740C3 [Oldenlandia corymbosa var. corymbosa]|uniref:OLC1v1002740C3 n=1 Tax=Oldenlandia corymbosa var. corymbosa TaxID=529605 RepID=A0AAV1D908_OLDCO|nr:OLC1v1002740C3 [Oldenlandia corymbosa var. corymbosa]